MRPLALALLLVGCASAAPTPSPAPPEARRLVLVTSPGWDAPAGTLRRFEREGGTWREVGEPVPVSLGRSGLGWGRGLHGAGAPAGQPGPVKREGDGRGAAGAFRLGHLYTYDAAPEGAKAAATRVDAGWRCVDDVRSARYNRVVDARTVQKDWSSDEAMRRDDALYRYVLTVEHNQGPVEPGAGSCIFLHTWRGPGAPTAGCIAMEEPALAGLIVWLGELGEDLLVVLPEPAYAALRTPWGLP